MNRCHYCSGAVEHVTTCPTQQPGYCPDAGEVDVHGECCGPLPRKRTEGDGS